MQGKTNSHREIRVLYGAVVATAIAFLELFFCLITHARQVHSFGPMAVILTTTIFAGIILFIAYGNFLYLFCQIGYHKRALAHTPTDRETLDRFYEGKAPTLAVLVPSYKEEFSIIRQTLLSAALSEYPQKSVVLLIDDPHTPRVLEDMVKLENARKLPQELQAMFDAPCKRFRAQAESFARRCAAGSVVSVLELNRLSLLFEEVAEWLETLAAEFNAGRDVRALAPGERFFLSRILLEPAKNHHARAAELRAMIIAGRSMDETWLACQYARLTSLFDVSFTSFERKKYCNLSAESNKAMNLNSYIALMGRSWVEVETKAGLELRECAEEDADFTVQGFDFVNTIDADTLMTQDYVLRLIHKMIEPGNSRIAVAQSPCSAIPGSDNVMERAAGSFLDVQFFTHQGYTHWGASFWVGANAMLRRSALEEIRETRIENGHEVAIYIQDRTVIEDTESSIDLVFKGWHIYNYPERMTFSAMPGDFGSLLIQRRRWANGGLIILPKLIGYTLRAPKNFTLMKEFFLRFNYLAATTLVCFVALASFFTAFGRFISPVWLLVSSLPFMFVLWRALCNNGYTKSEIFRVYAVNLMLLPVNMGGVLKQFQQMITGRKIPFGRTPKVPGRTAAPGLYYMLEVAMFLGFCLAAHRTLAHGLWAQSAFCVVNAGFMAYVLACLIGFKPMLEDMTASLTALWRKSFYHAEILTFPVRRALDSGAARRKRA